MVKSSSWLVVIIILGVFSIGTSQTQRWVYWYNGPGNSWDEASSLVYGADGNVYIAGMSTDSITSYDFTVISLFSTGILRWIYRDDGPGNDADRANSLVYGADGNIYIAGMSCDIDTSYDFTVISLISTCNRRWEYRYNGQANEWGEAYSLVYGADGNIYIAGYTTGIGTYSDFTVISLTSAGTQRWVYRYNGPGNGSDGAYSLVYGSDGNIYIAGSSTGIGTYSDFTVISLTSAGTQRWVYRHPGSVYDYANSLVYGSDGNIYIAGSSFGSGTGNFTVISLTSTGTERWVNGVNGPGNGANSLVYGSDGNIYIAGSSMGSGTAADFTVMSLTSTGNNRWIRQYNGSGNGSGGAFSLVYGSDGNIYVAGGITDSTAFPDFTVISLTSTGTQRWFYQNNDGAAYSLVYGSDGNIYIAGYSWGTGTGTDFTVISLTSGTGIKEVIENCKLEIEGFSLYPNPVKSFFTVRLSQTVDRSPIKIFDMAGKVVKEAIITKPSSQIDISDLPDGVYFISVKEGKNKSLLKVVKTK